MYRYKNPPQITGFAFIKCWNEIKLYKDKNNLFSCRVFFIIGYSISLLNSKTNTLLRQLVQLIKKKYVLLLICSFFILFNNPFWPKQRQLKSLMVPWHTGMVSHVSEPPWLLDKNHQCLMRKLNSKFIKLRRSKIQNTGDSLGNNKWHTAYYIKLALLLLTRKYNSLNDRCRCFTRYTN